MSEPGYDLETLNTRPATFAFPMLARVPAADVAVVAAPVFSAASESGNTVTMDTVAAHELTTGQPLVISACSEAGYNGRGVVASTPDSDTFTYYVPATGLGSPSGCVITTGNDSEMAAWAKDTATYADSAPAGSLAGPPGAPLSFGAAGSGFFGTLSHTNTANRV